MERVFHWRGRRLDRPTPKGGDESLEHRLHVVLVEPEIPPNTGNISRLCAGQALCLHLVGRLGFELSESRVRRAGLDHWKRVHLLQHPVASVFFENLPESAELFFFSKKAATSYVHARFQEGCYLVFGSESRGLPEWLWDAYSDRFFRIPMLEPAVRSLNLSNAVAVGVYEALRQLDFLE